MRFFQPAFCTYLLLLLSTAAVEVDPTSTMEDEELVAAIPRGFLRKLTNTYDDKCNFGTQTTVSTNNNGEGTNPPREVDSDTGKCNQWVYRGGNCLTSQFLLKKMVIECAYSKQPVKDCKDSDSSGYCKADPYIKFYLRYRSDSEWKYIGRTSRKKNRGQARWLFDGGKSVDLDTNKEPAQIKAQLWDRDSGQDDIHNSDDRIGSHQVWDLKFGQDNYFHTASFRDDEIRINFNLVWEK